MGKFLGAFDLEENSGGVSVVSTKTRLHAGCMSDGEIDQHIQILKDELDDVGKRMKVALRALKRRPMFGEPDNA